MLHRCNIIILTFKTLGFLYRCHWVRVAAPRKRPWAERPQKQAEWWQWTSWRRDCQRPIYCSVFGEPDYELHNTTGKFNRHFACFQEKSVLLIESTQTLNVYVERNWRPITTQRSVDLLHVSQNLLPQQMNQPSDNLRIPPLDRVQSSFRQFGELGVPHCVNGGRPVHVSQCLDLINHRTRQKSCYFDVVFSRRWTY